jgi:hypothetical protein
MPANNPLKTTAAVAVASNGRGFGRGERPTLVESVWVGRVKEDVVIVLSPRDALGSQALSAAALV